MRGMINLFSLLNMLFEVKEFFLPYLIRVSEKRQKEILIGQLLSRRGEGKKEVLFALG